MIIVPTEKQFDWKHAPVVLFLIVLLNVLVFFLYQSGDNTKMFQAVSQYLEEDYLSLEWPIYSEYLAELSDPQRQQEITKLYDDNEQEALAVQILIDSKFYNYLQTHAETRLARDTFRNWNLARPVIQDTMNSVSSVAHGLVANNLHPTALLTHQFLHAGLMHLLGNLFFLVICGFAVEAAIGHTRFLLFYLIGGVAAGMAQVWSNWQSSIPLVGASGAISAVMAMYLMVFRLQKIEFFYWVFFLVGYFRAPALVILPFYIGKEIYSYQTNPDSNIAFLAHAGGFVAGGALVGLSLLLDKTTLNREYLEDPGDDIAPQQQRLADIYRAIEAFRFSDAFKLTGEAIKRGEETFELANIRFNLLKIAKGKGYPESILRLWKLPKLLPHEIKKLEELWRENPNLHARLEDPAAVSLGMKFTAIGSTQSAEHIFNLLCDRSCTSQPFIVFCQKLAIEFQNNGQPKKAKHCQSHAQQLIAEGHNGLL